MLTGILALFLLPLAAHAALYASKDGPASLRNADWSSTGMLPPATADRDARVLVMSGRTGGWKGVFAVHSWIVLKPRERDELDAATTWSAGAHPVRLNGWPPDGRWFGDTPRVLVDVAAPKAAALIPKVEAAIETTATPMPATIASGPGPNSNTFVATVLRAMPELEADAAAERGRPRFPRLALCGPDRQRHRRRGNLWGVLGVKLGWVEGVEVNLLGLVAGLDLRNPGVKLPGFGRIGVERTAPRSPRRQLTHALTANCRRDAG